MIIHISDLHYSGFRDPKSLDLRLKSLAQQYPSAILLVTGDIVNIGSINNYWLATRGLMPFSGRLIAVPGNHDYTYDGASFSYWPEAEQRFNQLSGALGFQPDSGPATWSETSYRIFDLEPRGEKTLIVALHSVKRTPTLSDASRGWVNDQDFPKIDAFIKQPKYANHRKILALHHRPAIKVPFSDIMVLENADKLLNWVTTQSFEKICYGHQGSSQGDAAPQPIAKAFLHNANDFTKNQNNQDYFI